MRVVDGQFCGHAGGRMKSGKKKLDDAASNMVYVGWVQGFKDCWYDSHSTASTGVIL